MADTLSKQGRSALMASVRSSNTDPELRVRKALHAAGFRYRLHESSLPGRPDIVLPRFRTAVFVHGCFWHGHRCARGRRPATNIAFWTEKIAKNMRRDRAARRTLRKLGFVVRTIWACSLHDSVCALLAELQRARRRLRAKARRSTEFARYRE
jgi:DNA mismatch endonuclease (patch repair protein)